MSKKVSKPKLKDLEQKINELTDALKRERADAINLRQRHEKQISSLKDLAKADVVRQLLPVIDNFERALSHTPVCKDGSCKQWIDGIISLSKQFERVLEDMGVKKIKTVGEDFDPVLHEAVSMEEASRGSEGKHEIISEELQSGYTLGDNVIRHAMVKVKA